MPTSKSHPHHLLPLYQFYISAFFIISVYVRYSFKHREYGEDSIPMKFTFGKGVGAIGRKTVSKPIKQVSFRSWYTHRRKQSIIRFPSLRFLKVVSIAYKFKRSPCLSSTAGWPWLPPPSPKRFNPELQPHACHSLHIL